MKRSPFRNAINALTQSAPLRISLFVSGTLLLALSLNMALSVLTLEKIYTRSLLSEYSVVGRYTAEKIERSLAFGKTLEKFTGMGRLLASIHEKTPAVRQMFVFSPQGRPLFRLNKAIPVPENVMVAAGPEFSQQTKRLDNRYHLFFPLYGGRGSSRSLQGGLDLVLDEAMITAKVRQIVFESGMLLVAVGAVSALCFFVIVYWIIPTRRRVHPIFGIPLRTRALAVTSLVLILSQIAFSYFNVSDFRTHYTQKIRDKCQTLGSLVQSDIDYLLGLGIPIDKLVKIDTLLADILNNFPELAKITISDADGTPLYRVAAGGKTPGKPEAEGEQIYLPVTRKGETAGYVTMSISRPAVESAIRNLWYDSATVAVVSLIIGFEFVFLLVAFLAKTDRRHMEMDQTIIAFRPPERPKIPVRASVRTGAFVYAFSMALSMSFLPIYADQLYRPIAGLSREVVIGLPISAEMLFVAFSLLLGGYWLEKRGWFWPFIAGAAITGVSLWLCAIARSSLELIIYRGGVGFGYGLAVMTTQSVVLAVTSEEKRGAAITSLEAGYFSGFISSTAVGGMLAEKIGFRSVFIVGALLSAVSILFVLLVLRDTRAAGKDAHSADAPTEGGSLLSLFSDRDFVGSLLLSAIPSALCLVGFFYFASPLFLADMGVRQSNIARLLMPYGICMVYAAPMLSRWADSLHNQKIPVILGGLLGGAALVCFHFLNSIPMFVLILVLFSLSGGVSYGPRICAVSKSKAVQRIGVGKALGMFNSLERIGNIIGPIVVGSMVSAVGLTTSVSSLGLIYLLGTLLFFLLAVRTASGNR